jgi:hypothetical protein
LIIFLLTPAFAWGASQSIQHLIERRQQDEMPDDPPGIPARAQPGAPAAHVVTFGAFTSIQVNVAPGGADIVGDAANESSIAVDPTNPSHMAIGWRQFDNIASNFRQAGYGWSADGGRHWVFPGVLEPGVFRSDPVLQADGAGNFYYNSLKVVGNAYTCWIFQSTTGGLGWGPAVFAYGGDKCWMNVDRSGTASDGNIYNVWSIFGNQYAPQQFNRSTDGGVSYEAPVTINFSPIWGQVDVGPDGAVYVAGVDPNDTSIIWVARSVNAKNPLVTPTWDSVIPIDIGGSIVSFTAGSPNPGGLLGQVCIAVDQTTSGPTAGNVYVVCSVDPLGADPLDVRFIKGTNNGTLWGGSRRINDDPTNNGAWQWFATLSVAPGGRIDIIWNDTRNTGVSNESQLYYSSSSDGGGAWTANQQLSPTFDSHIGWPNQSKIGDYYDMVSDDVGADAAWAATFTGGQDVYYTRIGDYDCNVNGVADSLDIALLTSSDNNGNGIPDECDAVSSAVPPSTTAAGYRLYQNVPNPFNPTTMIRFEVPERGGHVTLQVFDAAGRLVKTLVNGFESGGANAIQWDGTDLRGERVATGVYFYRLQAPGFSESRKLVLMK